MKTYEQSMKRLQEIVTQIENGETDIDSLAARLKEARQLVDFCREKLTKVETEVKTLLEAPKP
jgi:exodeoxyribonuclease VII small subunit